VGQERRAFVRHPIALPVELDVLARERQLASTRDVGQGGVCLRVRQPLSVGARVVLTLPVLDHRWRFEARVVWAVQRGAEGWEVGLCFDEAEERTRARLVEQICQIEAFRAEERACGHEMSSEEAAIAWSAAHAAAFPEF